MHEFGAVDIELEVELVTAALRNGAHKHAGNGADLIGDRGMDEYFGTGFKKGRGMAQRSLDLIDAMYVAAEAAHPITGRGIGYKLFTAKLIASMARPEMQRVYRLLKEAREQGIIPWHWIVDETRELEQSTELERPGGIRSHGEQSLSP